MQPSLAARVLICAALVARTASAGSGTAVLVIPKDIEATARADELTKAMRVLAARGHKDAPSAKATDAAFTSADCEPAQRSCAAAIGETLSVAHVLVGMLEKRGAHYTVTLSLFDVATKQRVRSLRDTSSADARRWARTLYTRVFEEGSGEIVLIANAQRGQVLLDGLPVTELYAGHATISDVARGTHQLEIRAAGFHAFVTDVAVEGRNEQAVLLDPL